MFKLSSKKNTMRKAAIAALPLASILSTATAQVRMTEEPVPALDAKAMHLAIRSPSVGDSALVDQEGQTTVSWKTGINKYPFDYNVKCYAVDVGTQAQTCAEVADETPVGTVVTGNLPIKHSRVEVDISGFTDKYVDCYITVDGPHGLNSKCQYAGRATIPDATTITCDGATVGSTFTVNSVVYTVVDDTTIQSTPEANLDQVCTSLVTNLGTLSLSATFNEDISQWDTSAVTDMGGLFQNAAAFNQDVGDWDTSLVTDMVDMFNGATVFNQDLTDWVINAGIVGNTECGGFRTGSALTDANAPGLPAVCLA